MFVRVGMLALAVALLTAGLAQAAPRPFCADRPGKATPPCILDVGRWQLETGLFDRAVQRDAGTRDTADAWGSSELRAGLTRRVEAELAWSPYLVDRQRSGGVTTRAAGVGDLDLAVRAAITDPDADGLAVSIQPFVSAPTATHGQGDGGWEGGLRLPIAGQLTPALSFGATPEVDVVRNASGHGTHLACAGAFGVGHGFGPLALGAEVWGQMDDDPAGRSYQSTLDLTAAWSPNDDLHWDAGANTGLTRATPDVEVYLGVSRRF